MQAAKLLNGASAPRILCSVANHLRYLRAPIVLGKTVTSAAGALRCPDHGGETKDHTNWKRGTNGPS